jgi:putative redox protein
MPTNVLATIDPASCRIEARNPQGHMVEMDGDPPFGAGEAAGPKEALLAALAGCTAIDVVSILRKKRQAAESYEIAVSGESAPEHPKVFTSISVEHRVSGRVEAEALRRSIELSATQYCPVNAMLAAVARIEHHYRLTDAGGALHQASVVTIGPGRMPGDAV